MSLELEFWIIFSAIVTLLFFVDVYVTDHRKGEITLKASLTWSFIWIALAFGFAIFINYNIDHKKSIEFITAYLIEKSLSVDNLFVFVMIFSFMNIKPVNQPHILKWGILGAIVFRIVFILTGVELINHFQFTIYIFGIIIFYTAIKIIKSSDHKINPESNFFVKLVKKLYPVNTDSDSHKFFIKDKNTHKKYITISFISLILIETSDIIFAIDSIPAVLAITRDPFIALTSNIFAIMGLRALYFALVGVMKYFKYLKYGIAVALLFIGIKMMLSHWLHVDTLVSLSVILSCLGGGVLPSLILNKKN